MCVYLCISLFDTLPLSSLLENATSLRFTISTSTSTTLFSPSVDRRQPPKKCLDAAQGAGAGVDGHRCQNRGEGWQGGEEVPWRGADEDVEKG